MATQYAFRKIITDGLVLALDAADRNSYVSGSTVWRDLTGNPFSCSLNNQAGFNETNGGVITFSTSSGTYGLITSNFNFTPISQDSQSFSISCWARGQISSSVGARSLIGQDWGSTANGWNGMYFDPIYTRFVIGNNTNSDEIITTNTLSTSSFKMFTGIYNGTQLIIYVNGVFAVSGSSTVFPKFNDSNKSWTIGGNYERTTPDVSGFLQGQIPIVHIYNRALSAEEILQNYNAQKSRFNL